MINKNSNKRKRPTTVHFGSAISAPPTASTSAISSPAPGRTRILLEKTRVRQSDGRVSQARGLVEVATTPRDKPIRVYPDIRKQEPIYDWYSGGDVDVDRVEDELEEDGIGRQSRASDHPLQQWAEDHLPTYLEEMLRLEGRGDYLSNVVCHLCSRGTPDHRCRSCMDGGELVCQACVVAAHAKLPFHVIECWTGTSFERKGLKDLGMRIQLGHWNDRNRACPVPQPAANDDFVIVDVHGVHEVGLDYCGCGRAGHPTVQLLRAQLWPATTTSPKTAATFAVLRQYHMFSFESKCSALEFYQSLARQTDNLGSKRRKRSRRDGVNDSATSLDDRKTEKDRYQGFLRMTREWRHVRMLKRAGRGHDPQGLSNTKPGECALLCPACPQPGRNLPPNWENAPQDKQFLEGLFLAIDANFRLKRKDVSAEERDPGLGNGWAFFSDVNAYMDHVKRNWNRTQERSHCVAHDAVDKPDREARGTASSGIGAVDCARHNMKRPLAVGDLQLGERYINMDYMFFRSIGDLPLLRFFVSYDIACQWHINLWSRLSAYQDPALTIDGAKAAFTFLVPKFHLPAHIEACNLKYSFNLTPDVGQTDGEAPERGWANANPLARSTKEMGPGSRRDTLDDHFNDWNHKKIIALGATLRRKVEAAVPEMVMSREALQDMEESLGAEAVAEWTRMARRWEADESSPNPFETQRKDKHVAQVRWELAQEAAAREAAGLEEVGAVRGDMHITELIGMGLQLEDQQRILAFDVGSTGLHPTDGQRRAMVERSSKLRRKIFAWIDVQAKFFPGLENVREREDRVRAQASTAEAIPGIPVSEIKLWLPSSVAAELGEIRREVPVDTTIYHHEYRLRVGQAEEALHEVRRLLLVRTHVYKQKDTHARGVRANGRSQDKIAALNGQVQRAADQYRGARAALVALGGVLKRNEWERSLKVLAVDDVRGLPAAKFHDPERKKKTQRRTKKAKKIRDRGASWIWVTQGEQYNPADGAAMNEAVRIDWARVRARAHRWREEVDLLEAEMARVTRFLEWRAQWWRSLVGRRPSLTAAQSEGETAFALRQAAIQTQLARGFAEDWVKLPALIEEGRAGELGEDVAHAEDSVGLDSSDGDTSDDEEEAPISTLPQREIKSTYVDEILAM